MRNVILIVVLLATSTSALAQPGKARGSRDDFSSDFIRLLSEMQEIATKLPYKQTEIMNQCDNYKAIRQIATDICNFRYGNDKARRRSRGAGHMVFAMMSKCA